jgi:hypothetical protein
METVFGLPTHTYAIHAPIVLLPIAAIATIVLAVVPRLRRVVGWWMVGAIALVWLVRTGHEGTEVVWRATTEDLFG